MTRKNWKNAAARLSALAVMCTWAHAASAQESATASKPKGDDLELDEVVVTARMVKESLQDAPVAVTTLSGDMLDTRGIRDLGDASKLASSVKFSSDADVRAGVSIRGVGQSSDVRAAPGVGLFVDGIYQPSSAYYTVPFFDVQRIEVLKGPQGTLYGKNTMGGAINILSREPTDELGGSLMAETASGEQRIFNGVINLPMTSQFGNRTAVFYREADGLQDNRTTGEDALWRDDYAIRSRFVYDPDNGFTSSLSLFYADLESAPFNYSSTNEGLNDPIDNVTKDINGRIVSKYTGVNFTNSFEFESVTLTSLTSYDNGDVDSVVDGDYREVSRLRAGGVSDRDTYAQELRLADSGASDSNFHWLLGVYYSDDDIQSTSLNELNLGPNFGGFRTLTSGIRHETGETYAGFGQITYIVGDFEFVAGVRYDRDERNDDSSNTDSFPLRPAYIVSDESLVSKEWQPKVSVSYHFTPDVMAYGLAARGFRAGGFNPLGVPPEYATYDSELTTSYEGGLKSELFDQRLRLNSAIFYTEYTDILQTDRVELPPPQGFIIVSRNGGEAKSYGVELDAAYKLSPGLTVSGGYTYLDITNDETPYGLYRPEVTGFANHNANLQAEYLRPFGDEMFFGAHLSATYIGETPMGSETVLGVAHDLDRHAHTVVDASLDLTFQSITVSLFGKNIFDEDYYTSYIPAANAIVKTSALGTLNQPAQYGVRLSASF